MAENKYKIFPLGVDALTIELGSEISIPLNDNIISLYSFFEENPFEGYLESFPAYASLTIFFEIAAVKKKYPNFPTAFEAVKDLIEKAFPKLPEKKKYQGRLIEIPVDFSQDSAPDLKSVANLKNLTIGQVIKIFTAPIYRVFMLGFLPGFAYLGEVEEKIKMPRKATPRLKVPAGSVGIVGKQAGVYPSQSPAGWQIIGRTATKFFSPENKTPWLLRAGDRVKFYEVNQ